MINICFRDKEKYKLKKNKFYKLKDTNGGHPSLVYGYDDSGEEIKYKAIRFSSKKSHNNWELKKSINKKTSPKSFIKKQPEVRDYDSFVDERLKGFRVKFADRKLLRKVKRKK